MEGSARQHHREYMQFLHVAAGSLAEVGYFIDLARRIGYLTDAAHDDLSRGQESAARTLRALISYIERGGRPAVHGSDSPVQCP